MGTASASPKRVLVVGDWVIDEHWVVGRDRAVTASHQGESHFRALHGPESGVRALRCAGLAARLIAQTASVETETIGVGVWSEGDRRTLERMLKPGGERHLNPHRADALEATGEAADAGEGEGGGRVKLHLLSKSSRATTRIIRMYLQDDDDFRLLHRTDWEDAPPKPTSSGKRFWEPDPGLTAALQDDSANVGAIVLVDHSKGVVSPDLVDLLAKRYPRVPWYVYSERWHLTRLQGYSDEKPVGRSCHKTAEWGYGGDCWLEKLAENRCEVRLVFVPASAAREAIAQPARCLNNWCLPCGRPSWRAMQLMDTLARLPMKLQEPDPSKYAAVVVVPHGMYTVARTNVGEAQLLVDDTHAPDPREIGLPQGSLLFSSLVSLMLRDERLNRNARGCLDGSTLDTATTFAKQWLKHELGQLTHPEREDIDGEDGPSIATAAGGEETRPMPWSSLLKDWEDARDPQQDGILKNGTGGECLELWRAMTGIDGYICLQRRKRNVMRLMQRQIAEFMESRTRESSGRHMSMMLEASPGSGKSFLLGKLARASDMELLSFNVTQMVSPSEILDCFDSIVSYQFSRQRTKPVIAFFDEINATIGGEAVYGKFLDPIDQGTYVRAGKTFSIQPCIWIFAGTPARDEREALTRASKHSDFLSRLTLAPLAFRSGGDPAIARLERRYLAADLLQRMFPEVRRVSRLVLESFDLLCDRSPRGCKKYVRQFRGIRQGEVRSCNVPIEWIERGWKDAEEASIGVRTRRVPRRISVFGVAGGSWHRVLSRWNAQRYSISQAEGAFLPSWREAVRAWAAEAKHQDEVRLVEIVPRPEVGR